ncbi:bifunctional AP-4-A phosphorylase/ADP sulfurylase [Borealophlyctis nickersoniae]|nr:bifunctional AP-4-A phosphorylase/ADP sulfurylase [Borealophlyctis nickersoniae]
MSSSLAALIRTSFDRAVANGYVVFTESTVCTIPDAGINFNIRLAPSLARKPDGGFSKDQAKAGAANKGDKPNPFLPYDPKGFVTEFEHHNVLLNKFSIVKGHILLTTKEFESQYDPLNARDFAAAWRCLKAPGVAQYVGFYNCGGQSGARFIDEVVGISVPHKHIQLLPRADDDGDPFPPIASVLTKHRGKQQADTPFADPDLPFAHSFAFVKPHDADSSDTGPSLANTFRQVIKSAFAAANLDPTPCLEPGPTSANKPEPPSYNVVFTSDWMLVVPRRQEKYDQISINSVGFAGMLLAKSEADLEFLRGVGPIKILTELGVKKQ